MDDVADASDGPERRRRIGPWIAVAALLVLRSQIGTSTSTWGSRSTVSAPAPGDDEPILRGNDAVFVLVDDSRLTREVARALCGAPTGRQLRGALAGRDGGQPHACDGGPGGGRRPEDGWEIAGRHTSAEGRPVGLSLRKDRDELQVFPAHFESSVREDPDAPDVLAVVLRCGG